MAFFQLLMQAFAFLGPIITSPYGQHVMTCIETQSGAAAILACIASAAPKTAAEKKAHTEIQSLFSAHIAAHP